MNNYSNLLVFSNKKKHLKSYESLAEMSTLTKDICNYANASLEIDRNFIVVYPDNIFKPLPILCMQYILNNPYFIKDIIIFSLDNNEKIELNPLKYHIHNISYLAEGTNFLYTKAIPCVLDKNFHVTFDGDYSLIGNIESRNRLQQDFVNKLISRKKPAIFFSGKDFINIPDKILGISNKDNTIIQSFETNIGLCIFENIDRYIYSEKTYDIFLRLLYKFKSDTVNYIFHFSNPYNRYLVDLKQEIEGLVFHYGSSFMKTTKNYFQFEYNCENRHILENYNIDAQENYIVEQNIIPLKPLKPLMLDDRLKKCFELLSLTKENINFDNINYNRLEWIIYNSGNCVVKPTQMKILFQDIEENRYYYLPTKSFLEKLFESEIAKEHDVLQMLITEVNSLVNDLSNVRSFNNDKSDTPMAKNYAVIDFTIKLIKDRLNKISQKEYVKYEKEYLTDKFYEKVEISDKADQYNVIIGVFSAYEKSFLLKELGDYASNNKQDELFIKKISVFSLRQLARKRINPFTTDLVLPGPLPLKYFGEYFRGYDNIFLFGYIGHNYNTIQEHVQLVEDVKVDDEKRSFDYLLELINETDLETPEYVVEYLKRIEKIDIKSLIKSDERSQQYSEIRSLILKDQKFRSSRIEMDLNENLEKIQLKKENTLLTKTKNVETFDYQITISLLDKELELSENIFVNKKWPVLFISNIENCDIEEVTADELNIGDHIVILQSDLRNSFIDFICETFNLDDNIDVALVESWKDSLTNYILHKSNDIDTLYFDYVEECKKESHTPKIYGTFTNWINGNVTGTRDAIDLHLLGKIIKDESLETNYKLIHNEIKKLWSLRSLIGRKITSIIMRMLDNTLDLDKMAFEEIQLYELIKVYEITHIIELGKE